jgi:hypothetical protein
MPKVFYNGSIANFRSRIGNLIFGQLPDGTTVVSKAKLDTPLHSPHFI